MFNRESSDLGSERSRQIRIEGIQGKGTMITIRVPADHQNSMNENRAEADGNRSDY